MTQAATPQPHENEPLLDPEFLHRIERLDVLSRKVLAGKLAGERRSKRKGQSVEFADYRNYVAGDDLRFIDWNLYARLDRLFLRLFMEEEDMSLSVIVDVSASMDWGDPNKMMYACRVAAALGYIGLVNYNRVSLYTYSDRIEEQIENMRGRRPIPRLLDFLSHQVARGKGDLAEACKRFAVTHRQKGVVVLLSDFLDKGDMNEALRYLAGDRYDVYAMQLLAPQEINPEKAGIIGDLRLEDIEDGGLTEVSVSRALVKRYKATLETYCNEVRDACLKRGIAYMRSDTSIPFDILVLRYMREKGLLG